MTESHSQELVDVNEELRKYLLHYCTSNIIPGYAIMLRGPWGSGKTWFVDSLRKSLDDIPDKRSLYVSLFGVSKPSDIADQFFQQIHPKLSNKKVQKAWSIGKSFLKGTLKLDLNNDGEDDFNWQISVPDLEKWASTAGAVLIFDDLERVGMALSDILGYINQFVEHEGYRVIVIANEEKCVETIEGFPTIKEKVIGRTFEISPNVDAALNHFLEEIKLNGSAFKILNERRLIILKVFNRSKQRNLRLLRQATLDFENLWKCLFDVDNQLAEKSEFVDRLVEDLYSLSIEHRAGVLSIDVIHDLKNSTRGVKGLFSRTDSEGKDIEFNKSDHALDRHEFSIFSDLALLSSNYAAFFSRGYLSNAEALQGIQRSQYLLNNDTPNWQRLWYRHRLTDAEFIKYKNIVFREFKELRYQAIGEIFHVAGILLDLARIRLIKQTVPDMLQVCKKVVDDLERKNLIDVGPKSGNRNAHHLDLSDFGLGFYSSKTDEFKEFSTYYYSRRDHKRNKVMCLWVQEWMNELDIDPILWSKRITQEDRTLSWYFYQPVFTYVNPNKFSQALLRLDSTGLLKVAGALESRYEYGGAHLDSLLGELKFWSKTEEILINRFKKLSKLSLVKFNFYNVFLPQMKQVIEKLEMRQAAKKSESPE